MAEQASSSMWERFGDAASDGISGVDRMTGSMVDTMTGGSTQMDQLTQKYAESDMLAQMLTSNSPTLNIQMGLELVCDLATAWKESSDFDGFRKLLGQKVKQIMMGVLDQMGRTLVAALCNIVLKIRRMIVAKINQFLAEYVADACIEGLQSYLQEIANPENPLSIEEFTSSVSDMMTDMKEQVTGMWDEAKGMFSRMYGAISGPSVSEQYAAAKAAYVELEAAYEEEMAKADADLEEAMESAGDPVTIGAAIAAYGNAVAVARDAYEGKLATLEEKMAVLQKSDPTNAAFWTDKAAKAAAFLESMLCARTQAFAEDSDFGLLAGIHDQIKGFLQGCLFQQALKSANKFNPDGVGTDVMNRLNRLSNEGNMFELYNVALAAGVDLSSSKYQMELPSANSWVSSVYGDPYMFASETPINASQMASFLTEGLPSTKQMLSGNIPKDIMEQPYVKAVMTEDDGRSAAVASRLNSQIAKNEAIVKGANAKEGTALAVERADLDESYGTQGGHWSRVYGESVGARWTVDA